MADSFTPSSSAIASATQSSGGTTSSARLFGGVNTSVVDRVVDADNPFNSIRLPIRRRRPVSESAPLWFNAEMVDGVMAASWHRTDDAPAHDVARPRHGETGEPATSLAWEELDPEWEAWTDLALS
jgi:hypothetical protein